MTTKCCANEWRKNGGKRFGHAPFVIFSLGKLLHLGTVDDLQWFINAFEELVGQRLLQQTLVRHEALVEIPLFAGTPG